MPSDDLTVLDLSKAKQCRKKGEDSVHYIHQIYNIEIFKIKINYVWPLKYKMGPNKHVTHDLGNC